MPLFTVIYLPWLRAQLTGADKVPYENWTQHEYVDPVDSFQRAKELAKEFEDGDWEWQRNPMYDPYRFTSDENNPYTIKVGGHPRHKYLPYKLPASADYKAREQARLDAGEYTLLPHKYWLDLANYKEDYEHQYPRITEDKQLAYYANSRDARDDKLTTLKPTRYFSQFFNQDDMWDALGELGLACANLELKFVRTRRDIRFVYENGPESCMSGEASAYFSNDAHPAEAYASKDLELAVLFRGTSLRDDNTQIVARALCNRKTKQFVRIYGDCQRMRKALEEKGYTENQYALGGCKLLKIFPKRSGEKQSYYLLTPFLDGMCTRMRVLDDCLEIIREDVVVQGSTRGYANIPN